MSEKYNLEKYWTEVASEINNRKDNQSHQSTQNVAGDNDPYYIYKRNKFLEALRTLNLQGQVLEVGSGPGGNLLELTKSKNIALTGIDISQKMIDLAKRKLPETVTLTKIDGTSIPYDDATFDTSLTVTVLQHIVDDQIVKKLIKSMCRVTKKDIYIFERTEQIQKKSFSNIGRRAEDYSNYFLASGFEMIEKKYFHLYASQMTCGLIRRFLNSKKEGVSPSQISIFLQRMVLKVTKRIDGFLKVRSGFTLMHFRRAV